MYMAGLHALHTACTYVLHSQTCMDGIHPAVKAHMPHDGTD